MVNRLYVIYIKLSIYEMAALKPPFRATDMLILNIKGMDYIKR